MTNTPALKQYFDRGMIYKGHKIQPYCPRCETPLSSHEVSLGYKDVKDPSVYVKMKLKAEENTYFLVWTTTPWTLISNVALAVHPDIDYVKAEHQGQKLILAEARLSAPNPMLKCSRCRHIFPAPSSKPVSPKSSPRAKPVRPAAPSLTLPFDDGNWKEGTDSRRADDFDIAEPEDPFTLGTEDAAPELPLPESDDAFAPAHPRPSVAAPLDADNR